jgi:hypothetical protein
MITDRLAIVLSTDAKENRCLENFKLFIFNNCGNFGNFLLTDYLSSKIYHLSSIADRFVKYVNFSLMGVEILLSKDLS